MLAGIGWEVDVGCWEIGDGSWMLGAGSFGHFVFGLLVKCAYLPGLGAMFLGGNRQKQAKMSVLRK